MFKGEANKQRAIVVISVRECSLKVVGDAMLPTPSGDSLI